MPVTVGGYDAPGQPRWRRPSAEFLVHEKVEIRPDRVLPLADLLPHVRNYNVAVSEDKGDVVFLHRIVPGGADKSYGVHVAQLAGLPGGVINRAWAVLEQLEDGTSARGRAGGRRRKGPAGRDQQLPLITPGSPALDELKALDIASMTPLEAINKLFELQDKARSGS